jgi:hypothetical protein
MKLRSFIVGAASLSLLALVAFAAEEIKLDGIKCVINAKGAAKADKSVDYKGAKVYFCCENCPKTFDAKKHSTAANHQLVATKQAKQEKCPLSGEACQEDQKVKVAGVDVMFCCPDCQGTVSRASAEEQLKMVFSDEPFEKAFKVAKKK